MGRGKRWTQEENKLLTKMVEAGMSVSDIVKSGKLPNRTAQAISKHVNRLSIVGQKKKFIVGQITPVDIISLEEVLKRWSNAYQQICDLESASKEELERFRIIFMAASKYASILEAYHHYVEVEKRLEKIEKVLEELQKNSAAESG